MASSKKSSVFAKTKKQKRGQGLIIGVVVLAAAGLITAAILTREMWKPLLPERADKPTASAAEVTETPETANTADTTALSDWKATGSGGFHWTSPALLNAAPIDYLKARLPEFLQTIGGNGTEAYTIHAGTAMQAPQGTWLQAFDLFAESAADLNCSVLLSVQAADDGSRTVAVQLVGRGVTVGDTGRLGKTVFGFKDFNGDKKEEVFALAQDAGADNTHAAVIIVPFDGAVFGKALFRQYPETYTSGFTLEGAKGPYTLKHAATGYTLKNFEAITDYQQAPESPASVYQNALDRASVYDAYPMDLEGDGVWELMILQQPFHWQGQLMTIQKWDAAAKAMKTVYAEFLPLDEKANASDAAKAKQLLTAYERARTALGSKSADDNRAGIEYAGLFCPRKGGGKAALYP
ncbi:MAG: hypothetical protein LBR73_02380 [Oscillospiraceae bacterium]|nr:hypothetical protein [Oscillospiraceae bacterium]